MAEKMESQVRELVTEPLMKADGIAALMKEERIAGSIRKTDDGMVIIMECEGKSVDGISGCVLLSFDGEGNLRKVQAGHSSLSVSADAVGSISDVGGIGIFVVRFVLKGRETASVIVISKEMLQCRCRVRTPENLVRYLFRKGITPEIEIRKGRPSILLSLASGDKARLLCECSGDGYTLSALKMHGRTVRIHAADVSRIMAIPCGISIPVVDEEDSIVARLPLVADENA